MKYGFWLKFLVFSVISASLLLALSLAFGAFELPYKSDGENTPTGSAPLRYKTVIIDAGHGGEDGGASSVSGLVEKDVNLEIAALLCDMHPR